jgi:hypothetical protein
MVLTPAFAADKDQSITQVVEGPSNGAIESLDRSLVVVRASWRSRQEAIGSVFRSHVSSDLEGEVEEEHVSSV